VHAVYPNPNDVTEEYCFEELRAKHRGWLEKRWTPEPPKVPTDSQASEDSTAYLDSQQDMTHDLTTGDFTTSDFTVGGTKKPRKDRSRPRRKKVMEVRGETQTGRCRAS
jgi:Mad3/BUB1 homology region 2